MTVFSRQLVACQQLCSYEARTVVAALYTVLQAIMSTLRPFAIACSRRAEEALERAGDREAGSGSEGGSDLEDQPSDGKGGA